MKTQFESMLWDWFPGPDDLLQSETITWKSMVYGESLANIKILKKRLEDTGVNCDEILENNPIKDFYSFTYKHYDKFLNKEIFIKKIDEIESLIGKFARGSTFSLKSEDGKELL